jgi:tetratricopeptide (TPR) repeat protein
MTRAPWIIASAMAGVAMAAAAASAQIPPNALIIVLPFDNLKQEPRLAWMREGAAILLTDLLSASGEATVDREDRLQAFDRLQLPAPASLSRASSIKVGHAVGASVVVLGGVELSGDQLVARARLIRLDTGRMLPDVEAKGSLVDVFGVFGRLAQQLRGTGEVVSASDHLPPSPQVFELYVKGLVAETPATALAFLEQTLKAAPQFDRARIAIWEIHTDASDHLRALDVTSAIRPESRLSREGRFRRALSQLSLKRFDDALQTLRTLQTEERSASVANAIGVAELRKAATITPGRATYYFSQATELNPADGNLFFNLGYAYWLDKDSPAAIYWLREAVRRAPGDGDAHYILSVALQQTGAPAEAARERELATRLSSKYAGWEAKASGASAVPRGLERLDDALTPSTSRVGDIITTAGQREQDSLAAFHLDAGRRAYQREADREAIQELRRALYLSPYLAEAHLLMGRLHLRGGRPGDAVEALKIALWSEETVEAHIALAEAYLIVQDAAAARAEIDRALVLDPKSEEAQKLKVRIGGPAW